MARPVWCQIGGRVEPRNTVVGETTLHSNVVTTAPVESHYRYDP